VDNLGSELNGGNQRRQFTCGVWKVVLLLDDEFA
jgi:hypothetical protein